MSPNIPKFVKICIAPIWKTMIRSGHNFARHDSSLSYHDLQICELIALL